jgi:hypothetical protein
VSIAIALVSVFVVGIVVGVAGVFAFVVRGLNRMNW